MRCLTVFSTLTVFTVAPHRLIQPQEVHAYGPQIDEILSVYDQDGSPGVVVAFVREGQVEFAKGYEMANLEHGLPMTRETASDLGSVSKQFTAFAVLGDRLAPRRLTTMIRRTRSRQRRRSRSS